MPSFNPVYPPPIPSPWFISGPSVPITLALAGFSVLTANKTYLEGVWVPAPVVITSFTITHGSVHAGNLDMGIYDQNGNLLVHTGVVAATAGPQTVTLTAPFILPAGLYYMALWVDNSTDTYLAFTGVSNAIDNILIATGTNGGGLSSNFSGMGGTSGSTVAVGPLAHIQGTGY